MEVELTSSWEANLGLAGGDRDPRCGNSGWTERRSQNPISRQVSHVWQRATATPLGQTATKPTGLQIRKESQSGSSWRLYYRRNLDVGTGVCTLRRFKIPKSWCFLLAQEAVGTMKSNQWSNFPPWSIWEHVKNPSNLLLCLQPPAQTEALLEVKYVWKETTTACQGSWSLSGQWHHKGPTTVII